MERFGESGQMDADTFKAIFRLAFPERPEAKLDLLVEKVRNVEKTSGTIRKNLYQRLQENELIIHVLAIYCILMLIYLFCDGKTEDNLGQVVTSSCCLLEI